MITLREILDNLTYGELAHVAIGNAALGTILDKDYPRIISCLNGALTAVHKRFLLRTDEVFIQQVTGINTYYLRPQYSLNSGSAETHKYIIDTATAHFDANLFRIEKVFTSTGGAFVINDSSVSEYAPVYHEGVLIQEEPIYTPNFDVLAFTSLLTVDRIKVEYRAGYPKIVVESEFDPDLIELHIPSYILDAISLNIAARIYSPLTVGDGQ